MIRFSLVSPLSPMPAPRQASEPAKAPTASPTKPIALPPQDVVSLRGGSRLNTAIKSYLGAMQTLLNEKKRFLDRSIAQADRVADTAIYEAMSQEMNASVEKLLADCGLPPLRDELHPLIQEYLSLDTVKDIPLLQRKIDELNQKIHDFLIDYNYQGELPDFLQKSTTLPSGKK